jgi:hypothetical protein
MKKVALAVVAGIASIALTACGGSSPPLPTPEAVGARITAQVQARYFADDCAGGCAEEPLCLRLDARKVDGKRTFGCVFTGGGGNQIVDIRATMSDTGRITWREAAQTTPPGMVAPGGD